MSNYNFKSGRFQVIVEPTKKIFYFIDKEGFLGLSDKDLEDLNNGAKQANSVLEMCEYYDSIHN